MYPLLFSTGEFGRLPKHLTAHFSQCICEGWVSKGTQQGGDKVVEFIHFSTLIVYKCPFKSCHTPSAPCIFDYNGRAGCGKLASGRKPTARFKREWTALRIKFWLWQINILKLFLELEKMNWMELSRTKEVEELENCSLLSMMMVFIYGYFLIVFSLQWLSITSYFHADLDPHTD